nr:transcription factor SRM1-like [Lolium perenne]
MEEATASGNYSPQQLWTDGPNGDQAPSPASQPALESSGWTRQQDKLLELLLCRMHPRWDRIAVHLGGKTPDQVHSRYGSMVDELRFVLEAPRVETPPEWDLQEQPAAPALTAVATDVPPAGGTDDVDAPADDMAASATSAMGEESTAAPVSMAGGEANLDRAAKHKRGRKRTQVSAQGRNRAVPWSEEEHRLFLKGITEYGIGKWQKLSRELVTTRSASQIASHYQKYAIRQAKLERNQVKRPSIHDISINTNTLSGAADDRGDENPAPTAAAAIEAESGTTYDAPADEDEVAVGDDHGTVFINN